MNVITKLIEDNKDFWSPTTIRVYRAALNSYFDIIGCDLNTYFNDKRDYNADITEAWKVFVKKPPGSRGAFLAAVKVLMMYNDIEIKERFWKDIKRKARGKRPFTQDIAPTNTELKKILHYADIRGKALFLFAATSGMRINEILQLTLEDIDLNSDPVKISIRREITKAKENRITFITQETKQFLLDWLKQKKDYLQSIDGKCNFKNNDYRVDMNDPRIFPFTYHTALRFWHRLIELSGFNEREKSTNRYKMHVHSLRKFAKTRYELTMSEKIANSLIGHEGYLSTYDRFTFEHLRDAYKKAEDNLLVFEQVDIGNINEQLKEVTQENKGLQQQLNDIRMELLEVKLKQVQELQRQKSGK